MQQELPYNLTGHDKWLQVCDLYRHDIGHFYIDVLGTGYTWQQAELFNSVVRYNRTSVTVAQGAFDSTRSAAILALWHLCIFPESQTIFLDPKANQLRKLLWKEIEVCLKQMQKGELAWLTDYINISDEHVFIKGHRKTWNFLVRTSKAVSPCQMAGSFAENLMIVVSKAAEIEDSILEVINGAATQPDNRICLISKPIKNAGFFYDTHHKLSREFGGPWNPLTFSAEDSPLVSKSKLKQALLKYGSRDDEQYKIHIRGQFPSTLLNSI